MTSTNLAVVTGAAAGIGLDIARRFEADDYRVVVCDADAEAVTALSKTDPQIRGVVADVSRSDDIDALFEIVASEAGNLSVLINNAGVAGPTAAIEDIDPGEWEHTVAVDLNGTFYCTRRAVPLLKAGGGGSIINIASSAALFGYPLRTPYAACKWAMIGMTKTLAMELGPAGIRVNAICPGSVEGPRIDRVIERDAAQRGMTPEEIRGVYLRQTSLRSFVKTEDIANVAAFLASSAGAMISGQALGVDGHTESLSNWLD